MAKGFEDVKTNAFLQFISNKHKIPLSIITKAPKLQVGYVTPSPFRKKQMSARFTSTRSTSPACLPWDSSSISKIRTKMQMKKSKSKDLSTLQIFLVRERIVSQRCLRGNNTFFLRRKFHLLWVRTKGRSSRCLGAWLG